MTVRLSNDLTGIACWTIADDLRMALLYQGAPALLESAPLSASEPSGDVRLTSTFAGAVLGCTWEEVSVAHDGGSPNARGSVALVTHCDGQPFGSILVVEAGP